MVPLALLAAVALLSVLLVVSQQTPTEELDLGASSDASLVAIPGSSGMVLRNDSDVTGWSRCRVEIDGGFFDPTPFSLPAQGRYTVLFNDFTTASGQRLSTGQGYASALRKVELECADATGATSTLTPRIE
jgi:hypothetical protein